MDKSNIFPDRRPRSALTEGQKEPVSCIHSKMAIRSTFNDVCGGMSMTDAANDAYSVFVINQELRRTALYEEGDSLGVQNAGPAWR